MVQGGGFEPPKLARQIYSLIPLATREPLPKTSRHCPALAYYCQPVFLRNSPAYSNNIRENGAGERSRTPDRLITSQLLYQLSYASIFSKHVSTWRRDSRETFTSTQHLDSIFVVSRCHFLTPATQPRLSRLFFDLDWHPAPPKSLYGFG